MCLWSWTRVRYVTTDARVIVRVKATYTSRLYRLRISDYAAAYCVACTVSINKYFYLLRFFTAVACTVYSCIVLYRVHYL